MGIRDVIRNGKRIEYRSYKLQPSDGGKTLMQIAREQLNNESAAVDIIRQLDAPDPTTGLDWAEIANKNSVDIHWTILLPVAQDRRAQPNPPQTLGTFKLTRTVNIRTSPKVAADNFFMEGIIGTEYKYEINSKQNDPQTGTIWVDVTATNFRHKAKPGVKYWICVREGAIRFTDPPF